MSETRDLGVPLLAFLAGLAVAIWNATSGLTGLAVAAGVLGLGVGAASLKLTLKRGPGPATALALGGVLAAAALAPPFAANRDVLLAVGLAVSAFAIPGRPRSESVRMTGLVLAAALALGGAFLATRPGALRAASGYLLAVGVALAWLVVKARPLAEVVIPKGPKVAVYGGSFDPFHLAHRDICEQALSVCHRVLVVVSARPPHKAGSAT